MCCIFDAFCDGTFALNSAAGMYYSLKGLVNSCELTLKGLDEVAAMYAAKQEAWYKEHAGYTTNNLDNIQESGASVIPQSVAEARNNMNFTPQTVNMGGSESVYIPRDSEGNPIPLKKQRINGQDIPLPDPAAEGRPHTVLGGKVSSETGEVYRQSATFPGGTWPSANGYDVPWSEVHWTDHGTSQFHTNPHEHIFEYNPDKGGWIRKGPSDF